MLRDSGLPRPNIRRPRSDACRSLGIVTQLEHRMPLYGSGSIMCVPHVTFGRQGRTSRIAK